MIRDGAALIENGIISAVGPGNRIENLAEARLATEINAAGRVVMPGFVDPQVDLFPSRFTGTPSKRIIGQSVNRILDGCLRHGTTTLEAKVGAGLGAMTDLRILRQLAGMEPSVAFVTAYRPDGDVMKGAPTLGRSVLDKLRRRDLVRFVEVDCQTASFDLQQLRQMVQLTRTVGLEPKLEGCTATETGLVALGVEFAVTSMGGLARLDSRSLALLAGSRTIATILPFTPPELRPDAREMIDGGVAVALASGFQNGFSNSYSMQHAISTACRECKLTVEEAISAATINAAHSMREEHRAGSLQYGRSADLVILDIPDYRELATYHGVNLAVATMRRGEFMLPEDPSDW
jgi:imidazolonepropionase